MTDSDGRLFNSDNFESLLQILYRQCGVYLDDGQTIRGKRFITSSDLRNGCQIQAYLPAHCRTRMLDDAEFARTNIHARAFFYYSQTNAVPRDIAQGSGRSAVLCCAFSPKPVDTLILFSYSITVI